ncbi:MAG: TOBE domain-containing protein [Candidatus Odinarchaeia archaeon]
MDIDKSITFKTKIWLEYNGKPLLGRGGAALLRAVKEEGSLKKATDRLKISYRYAWGYIKNIENVLGKPIVKPFKGGFKGGGGMSLTPLAELLLRRFTQFNEFVEYTLKNPELWQTYGLRSEKRNRIQGVVSDILIEGDVALVEVKCDTPTTVTSIITTKSAQELKLVEGKNVLAIVKATEVTLDVGNGEPSSMDSDAPFNVSNGNDISISARNKFRSVILSVKRKGLITEVKVKTLQPVSLAAVITREAAEELNLKKSISVDVVFKATKVMIATLD